MSSERHLPTWFSHHSVNITLAHFFLHHQKSFLPNQQKAQPSFHTSLIINITYIRVMMPRLADLATLLAAVVPALTTATLADRQWTETVGPQELGSTIIDASVSPGTMVYSINHCSIVHSTQCYTSLSTGGHAPASTSTGSVPGYSSSASESPAPSYGQSDTSSDAYVPVSTTPGPENPPASTTTSAPGGEESTTASSTSDEGATSTSKVPDVPTGAVAMGASAVLGNVLVAALAAIAI